MGVAAAPEGKVLVLPVKIRSTTSRPSLSWLAGFTTMTVSAMAQGLATRAATAISLRNLFMAVPLKHGVDAEADQVGVTGGNSCCWEELLPLIVHMSVLNLQSRRGVEVV